MRLHVRGAGDGARCIDEGDRERQGGVLHPEALLLRPGEDEEHAVIRKQRFATALSL